MQQIDAYDYDTLHRLTTVDYNTGGVTGDEVYVYDSLGNRVTYTDQRNSITRTYANNAANEYTKIAGYDAIHDPAGNLSRQVVSTSGGATKAYVYSYDCDNRLTKVHFDNNGSLTTLATFAYDALGRKITAWTQFDVNAPGGDDQTKDLRFYHDGQVEIADYDANGALSRRFINGTQYIDERVALIDGAIGDAETYYYLLQELYTVTGLIEKNGALAEANVYDGYGKVHIWDYSPGDFDRDGDVDTTDQGTMAVALINGGANKSTPDPSTDFDGDGDTDSADLTAFNVYKNAGGAVTEAFTSSIGNPFFFTGRRLYFLETLPEAGATALANQQIQHNRARHYSPELGRWLERDPAEYVDALDLYEYIRSGPLRGRDPFGLKDWLDKLADFVAGVGDSLSMGLTRQVRSAINWGVFDDGWDDPQINPDSGYYKAGEWVEVSVEIAVTVGGASLRYVAKRTVRESIEGGARRMFRNANKLEGGIVHHINPILGHPGGKAARFPLPFEFAARGHWNMEHISTGSRMGDILEHMARHRKIMQFEAVDRLRTATMGVRQVGNAIFNRIGCDCQPTISIDASFSGEAEWAANDYSEVRLPAQSVSASASLIETSTIRCHASRQ